jgi:alkyl sulfatase BDS1-like metallo-beta-lactamase superfamily hydrolase
MTFRFTILSLVLACCAAQAQTPAAADPPSRNTIAAQAAVKAGAPWADQRDFEFARRGFLGTRSDPVIRNAAGQPVWNLGAFDFLQGDAPATVNPSLWRQGELLALNGLFQVTDRIWQVRGFDLANTTFVRGDTGWIVIDTLGSIETARAALELVNEKLGPRPIEAIIYTHPHIDHFGGAGGMVSAEDVRSGKVQVIAPKGFLQAAVGENVIAGPAMQRRAVYQFGARLPFGATGQVNSGIGPGLATGTPSLVPPTKEIAHTGETLTIDGVKMVFQFTAGTEAPVEFNIGFPDWHVVDMAENANATQHNILTPRGAVVRDAKAWADALTQAISLFGDADTLITSHGWPRFGRETIHGYLAKHRDAYEFLHDQTVRLMNQGLNGDEIAARLKLPAALEQEWYDRPYYGSLSFNSRAVYQYYLGWYDGNPVHLTPLPPQDAGRKYVQAMGGAAHVIALAQASYDQGDYAWAAELLNRVVMADAKDGAARALLARCYDQLGYQTENSLWRNMYLSGAQDLRGGVPPPSHVVANQAAANLPTSMIFDVLAVRLNADKVGDGRVKLRFVFPDRGETTTVTVENGVLIHEPHAAGGPVDATLTVNRADFLAAVLAGQPLAAKIASGQAKIEGDPRALQRLVGWLDRPQPNFPLVSR